MKKILLASISLVTLITAKAQQIEFGPTIGYRFNNIVDRKSETKRAVIGDALWKTEYGFQAVYNFRKPGNQMNYRLTAFYQNQKRGSVSEKESSDSYEIDTNGLGLMFGVAREFSPNWILTLNIGLGTNSMNTKNYYKGEHTQTSAFDKLHTDLEPKSNEVNFLYQIGIERVVIEDKLLVFVDFHGDAGISKMNKSYGSYGNQGLGFGAGIRYLIDLSKKD